MQKPPLNAEEFDGILFTSDVSFGLAMRDQMVGKFTRGQLLRESNKFPAHPSS